MSTTVKTHSPTFTATQAISGWFDTPQTGSPPLTVVSKQANGGSNAITYDLVAKILTLPNGDTAKLGDYLITDADGMISVVTAAGYAANYALPTVTLTSTNGTAGAAADLTALKAEAEKIGDDVRAIHAALVAQGILSA